MEYDYEFLVSMHYSLAEKIIRENGGFQSFEQIATQVVRQAPEWGNVSYVQPALERLIAQRQIEVDPKLGYCRYGSKNYLTETSKMANLPREVFDQLSPAAKTEFFTNGGRVA